MLWPDAGFAALLSQVALRRDQGWNLDVAVQTNLVQPITPELLALFREHRVSLGVSLDGPRAVNDAARVDRLGRGTYERVMANVKRMLADGDGALIGGFLSVANPSLPPAEFLAWVRSLPVPEVDVLWPIEFNWRNPPWPLGASHAYAAEPRYGAWYAELFRAWWALDDPGLTIRLFNNLLHVALGGQGHIDALVNDSYNMFVVNTDGSYEYPDYLRVAGDGSASTPFMSTADGIAVLAGDPLFARLLDLRAELPAKCGGAAIAGSAAAVSCPAAVTPGTASHRANPCCARTRCTFSTPPSASSNPHFNSEISMSTVTQQMPPQASRPELQSADFVELALVPDAVITAELVGASAFDRLDDFRVLADIVQTSPALAAHRERWQQAVLDLDALLVHERIAIGSSPCTAAGCMRRGVH